MTTLLLRLEGPMQSWGTHSRFNHRDTELVPSKSGVIGLLCAALGRQRGADLSDLAALEMAVRIDRPGRIETDFHTAEDVPRAGDSGSKTVMSWRHYLADASFLVGLTGPHPLLVQLHRALCSPRWPLFLGRRAFPPARPVYIPDGLVEKPLIEALASVEWLDDGATRDCVREVTSAEEGDPRQDVPVSFLTDDRRFATRWVRREPLLRGSGKEG